MADTISTVVATINGQEISLTLNSESGKYEAQTTAPSGSSFNLTGGYYPVSIKATYTTGNSSTVNNETSGDIGTACRLVVKEKIKPTVVINSPSNDSFITNSSPTISLSLRDNTTQATGFSGIDLSTLSCLIHKTAGSSQDDITLTSSDFNSTSVTGGYDSTYTPTTGLTDGSYSMTVTVADNDGNKSETNTITFTVDTVAPDLTVTNPPVGYQTSVAELTVTGTTNDITSSPVTVAIKLNDVCTGNVLVGSDGSFSKDIILTQSGDNTITVTATDSAGKSTTITRTVYYSTALPVFTSVSIVPNPVDGGKTYTIFVEVS